MANECPIWGNSATIHSHPDTLIVDSSRAGGKYEITGAARAMLGQLTPSLRASITNWLMTQRRSGIQVPVLHSDSLKIALTMPQRKVSERVDELVLWFEGNLGGLGKNLPIGFAVQGFTDYVTLRNFTDSLSAALGSKGDEETLETIEFALKLGLLEAGQNYRKSDGGFFSLSFDGYKRAEELQLSTGLSEQAFVAMWFHSSMESIFENGFKPAIEDAGYRPLRIDRKEHNNKIDDEIIAEIRRSKFVVADFTSQVLRVSEAAILTADTAIARGGVYFEAGFAKGLNKEVIWTVRKDLIDLVHFDTRQFAHITWESATDLRKNLAARISATLSDGPLKQQR